VSLDAWILALHVLSAFVLGAGVILYWVLIVAVREADTPDSTLRLGPMASVAEAAVGAGGLGTIVLGIWLALSFGDYDIWDGWIVAAIVLWLIAMELGRRTSATYREGVTKARELQTAGQTAPSGELLTLNRARAGVVLQLSVSVVVLLILVDMIWKPGA
jgi:hypothetical protein